MRLQTFLLPGFAVVTVALTVLAWHQYSELITLRADRLAGDDRTSLERQLAKLREENQALAARLANTTGVNHGNLAGSEGDDGKDGGNGPAGSSVAAVLAANTPETKRQAELDLIAALSDLPEFQKLVALQQRATVDEKYASLFRKLHLSPDQQEKFASLLADKQSAFAEALVAAHDQGLTGKEARSAAKTVAQATNQEIDNSLKSLLGDQGYRQYQNYERTMPQRETVSQVAQRLSYTDTPLSPKQQDQLVQALATGAHRDVVAAKAAAAAGGQPAGHQPKVLNGVPNALGALGIAGASGAVITPSGVTNAQSFLSPQQVAALQQVQQEQQAQLSLSKLVHTGVKPAPAPKPGPKGKG